MRTVDAAVAGGLLSANVDRDLVARQLLITFVGVLEFWIQGDLDDDAFRAQSLYGSTLVVLALASPSARPRLLERLNTIEKRLKKRLRGRARQGGSHARRRDDLQPELHRLGSLRGGGARRVRRRRARSAPIARSSPRSSTIARIADETGFDAVWTIEHHFTPYTMVTNPLQYLTYIAGITQKVDLGTMVDGAALAQPGAGRRGRQHARRLPRRRARDHLRRRPRPRPARVRAASASTRPRRASRFDESLQVLRQLLGDRHVRLRRQALPDPRPAAAPAARARPLRTTCGAPAAPTRRSRSSRATTCGRCCIPTTSLDLSLETARKYARLRREAGHRAARTPSSRCGPTSPTARPRRAAAPSSTWSSTPTPRCATTSCAARTSRTSRATSPTARCRRCWRADPTPFLRGFFDSHPWGTPAQTIKRATELAEAFGTDEIMFVFKYGGMPMAEAEKSMQLFASEVMPALKDLKPEPIAA